MKDIGKHSFRSVLLQPTSQSIFHACLQRVKADLEAFSCNKEAATVTMKSKDFNFFNCFKFILYEFVFAHSFT